MLKGFTEKWLQVPENVRLPLRIVLVYLIFGGLWILFSDQLLGYLPFNADLYLQISVAKGWFYVLVTGLLLYQLIQRDFSFIQKLNQELHDKNNELTCSYEEIQALYEEVAASEETLKSSYDDLHLYREKLEASDERYKLVMKASQEGFWDYRLAEGHLEVSDGVGRIFGSEWEQKDSLINEISRRIHPEDRHMLKGFIGEEELPQNGPKTVEFRVRHENGSYRWTQLKGLAIRDSHGIPHRIIGAVTDIHDKVLQKERIEYYAFHDPSTGFYNRDYMLERLSKIMQGPDSKAELSTFMVVGIQGMDRLVSVYGTNISEIIHYQVGMSILKAVGNDEAIAMLGLGRFGIILGESTSDRTLQEHIDTIDQLTKMPIRINRLSVSIQMAYGASRCAGGVCGAEILVQHAETAFNHAVKEQLREHVVWYDSALQEEKDYLGKVEFLLRQAIEAGEFSLVYQPQVTGTAGTVIEGYEALIRWQNPELGNVNPGVFIAVAEATGQIDGIGEFVVTSACRFLREFMDATNTTTSVSINASLIELMNPDYIQRLMKNVNAYDLKPEYLHIEITESALAKYLDSVIENLKIIRDLGFEIHLDDFGTGYSSLNHLGRLPVHALKIDKTFVWQMENDPRMNQMTALIIQVGHKLDLRIIAEGVETEAQFEMLHGMGCDSYQGYYFSKPITEQNLLGK